MAKGAPSRSPLTVPEAATAGIAPLAAVLPCRARVIQPVGVRARSASLATPRSIMSVATKWLRVWLVRPAACTKAR